MLLVTHEHGDHNAVEVIDGSPAVLRATAGTHDSPLGQIVGVASEHDEMAGTERGPNTIFVFTLDGVRVAHFGDFGQTRAARRAGGRDRRRRPRDPARRRRPDDRCRAGVRDRRASGAAVGGADALRHRTGSTSSQPADDFLAKFGDSVHRADGPIVDLAAVADGDGGAVVVVPAAP